MRNERGHPVRMIGINYDITERKRAEDALQRVTAELEHRVAARTLERHSRVSTYAPWRPN